MADPTFDSLAGVVAAISRETEKLTTSEPEEMRRVRTGTMANQAGTNNQYFTTWDFNNGMLRDQSMYTWYHLVKLCEDPDFSLPQLIKLVNMFDHPYSNYLRYSGLETMGTLAAELRQHLPEATRDEFTKAVRLFCAYLNLLAGWSFHTFPWGLGKELTYRNRGKAQVPHADLARRVNITSGTRIRLTWGPVGTSVGGTPLTISVRALLATKENPQLCGDFIEALPFRFLQDHAAVSGQSMYTWVPGLVSTARVQVKERQCDAPVGRIRFSQGTGNKMIIQYGTVTEDIETPVLGQIVNEDIGKLTQLAPHILRSTFDTKEDIWVTVALA